MNFAELRFWEIFAGALTCLLLMRAVAARSEQARGVFDRAGLLALGLLLLLAVSWITFVIFLTVTVATYLGVAAIRRCGSKHWRLGLAVLIPFQIAPLFYYKYADFVANGVLGLKLDALHGLIIPIGISFYTFQKIAFACDTLAFGKPLPSFFDFLNFAGFFPQIVAGPIERRDDLLPQVEQFRFRWSRENLDTGVSWIALGLFFKRCLADNISAFFQPAALDNAWAIWIANAVFGFQIYYDFAGYSLIALGLGRCLGVRLTLNFTSPYCSRNPAEFWRRWHISLSQWLRDYIYIPLGGSRVRYWMFNIAVVFLVSGVWHGAGWNFLLWGALHAAFLLLHRGLAGRVPLPSIAGWIATIGAVFFAWLSFYETNPEHLWEKLTALCRPSAYSWNNLLAARLQWSAGEQFTFMCIAALLAGTMLLEWRSLVIRREPYAELLRLPILSALVGLTVLLAPGHHSAFIYFAF